MEQLELYYQKMLDLKPANSGRKPTRGKVKCIKGPWLGQIMLATEAATLMGVTVETVRKTARIPGAMMRNGTQWELVCDEQLQSN